eukprot:1161107-Pelagomonas_calceolata.AAC.1
MAAKSPAPWMTQDELRLLKQCVCVASVHLRAPMHERSGYIAVPAYKGSLAEAKGAWKGYIAVPAYKLALKGSLAEAKREKKRKTIRPKRQILGHLNPTLPLLVWATSQTLKIL